MRKFLIIGANSGSWVNQKIGPSMCYFLTSFAGNLLIYRDQKVVITLAEQANTCALIHVTRRNSGNHRFVFPRKNGIHTSLIEKGSSAICRTPASMDCLILRPLACGSHLNKFGTELAENLHEVPLGGHDFADVFVGHWRLIQTGGNERHALLLQKAIHILPVEFLVGGLAAHRAACPVRCRV